MTTVQQAIYPLLLTCSVFGIGIYSQKKFYLNILYNLTVWTSYGYLCYYVITALRAGIWFQSISNSVHIRIGVLSTITSIVISVYRDKVCLFKTCLKYNVSTKITFLNNVFYVVMFQTINIFACYLML